MNKNKNLQKDFNSKYSGSSLSIFQTFQYTFDAAIFTDEDDTILTYEAFIKFGNDFVPIPDGYWINF